jgi:hypothetical protein
VYPQTPLDRDDRNPPPKAQLIKGLVTSIGILL